MAAFEWSMIHLLKRINHNRSSELQRPRFKAPSENLKRQFKIGRMRSCEDLSSRDNMAQS